MRQLAVLPLDMLWDHTAAAVQLIAGFHCSCVKLPTQSFAWKHDTPQLAGLSNCVTPRVNLPVVDGLPAGVRPRNFEIV